MRRDETLRYRCNNIYTIEIAIFARMVASDAINMEPATLDIANYILFILLSLANYRSQCR